MSVNATNTPDIESAMDNSTRMDPMDSPMSGGHILSASAADVIVIINSCILSVAIGLFGSFANVINMAVFLKMSFSDPINMSLFALSLADLCGLLTLQIRNISLIPLLENSGIPLDWKQIGVYLGGISHHTFAKITALITAYISFERCLCVILPLRVKSFLTKKTTFFVLVTIYAVILGSTFIPIYSTYRLEWTFKPFLNKSIISVDYSGAIAKITFINILGNISFALVAIFTAILIQKLRSQSKLRKDMVGDGNKASVASDRDRKVAKMAAFISSLFIVCMFPVTACVVASALEPEFSVWGRYKYLNMTFYSFSFLLETINSSVNIFIYLKMSSKYQATFKSMFCSSRK